MNTCRISSSILSLLFVFLFSASAIPLSGCAGEFHNLPDVDVASGDMQKTPIGELHGSSFGGQQAIYNSHVYLMKASTSGYATASTSILTAHANTQADANGNYYTTTDAAGNFNITGDYTCNYNATTPAQSDQLFLYSIGGIDNYLPTNPTTTGTNNPMIGLLAVLGSCPSNGTFAGHISFIYVNEISTVAAAYALAGFAGSGTQIGSPSGALARQGIANAFANAGQLYDLTGSAFEHEARQTTPGAGGTTGAVPRALIDTLGNILAMCVNQTPTPALPPASGACQTLYNDTGNATDTAAMAIYIAQHPGKNVAALYALQPTNAEFIDNLPSQPKDFTVGINYSGVGLATPVDVAIDALGDAWVTSSAGKLSKFSPLGVHASGSPFSVPQANYVAIDQSGNAWTSSAGSAGSVYEISNAGATVSGSPYSYSDLNNPAAVANDGVGDTYIANPGGGGVLFGLLGATGDVDKITGSGGSAAFSAYGDAVLGSLLNQIPNVSQVAIDSAGYVWISGDTTNCTALLLCYGENLQRVSGGTFNVTGISFSKQVATYSCFTIFFCSPPETPEGIAIDSAGNGWVAISGGTDELGKFTSTGTQTNYTGGGLNNPFGVAIDGSNNVWVANTGNNSVSEFTSAGTAVTSTSGYTGGTLSVPTTIDIDGSGDVWIVNSTGNGVTELIGVATPAVRPLADAIAGSKLGSRP